MALAFKSKAQNLKGLKSVIRSACIAPLVSFVWSVWSTRRHDCLNEIENKLACHSLIVRSSSVFEDQVEVSNAGAFKSILNVKSDQLGDAIDTVFASYGAPKLNDEVLIQPMLDNVRYSGVVFSHDPNTGAPYRIINWAEGADTTVVTSGRGGQIWQTAATAAVPSGSLFEPIIALIDELLGLFEDNPIDCEFAITEEDDCSKLWLLQIRPLAITHERESIDSQFFRLSKIQKKVKIGMQEHPFLMGAKTVYGVMPDWNPAEIIGIRPKPLALSLYRELVTDAIWAYQRSNYGYRNLRSFPLMKTFAGLPYIDVRVSFNSFIPADLDYNLGSRLVDYYLNKLVAQPKLHDKVEFEIVWSCYTLDLMERLKVLGAAGFTEEELHEIAEGLRRVTNAIVHPKRGLWLRDSEKLIQLRHRHVQLMSSKLTRVDKIYWLIEDLKRYGTLPFAGLARAGFIAVQLLESVVNLGIFSRADYENFLGSISTVSSELKADRISMSRSEFLNRYGHLRPGTYDICSPRYDQAPDRYFDWDDPPSLINNPKTFVATRKQLESIDSVLESHQLESNATEMLTFIRGAIEQREYAKFEFTKSLSDALSLIAIEGKDSGLDEEELAFCDINVFLDLQISTATPQAAISASIEKGKSNYVETSQTTLPPLITEPEDIFSFQWPEMAPNFISRKKVVAPVVCSDAPQKKLAGSIICIPHADPGYDWLFSHSIAGLITAWGGANSHMAIRASEQMLPAVIGAGEILYRRWSNAKRILLDCPGARVEILE